MTEVVTLLLLPVSSSAFLDSPVSKAKSTVHRSDPAESHSFSCRSVALGHAWRLRVSKVGQDMG